MVSCGGEEERQARHRATALLEEGKGLLEEGQRMVGDASVVNYVSHFAWTW